MPTISHFLYLSLMIGKCQPFVSSDRPWGERKISWAFIPHDKESGEARGRRHGKIEERFLCHPVLPMSHLISRGFPQRAIFLTFYDLPVKILTIQILSTRLVNVRLKTESWHKHVSMPEAWLIPCIHSLLKIKRKPFHSFDTSNLAHICTTGKKK